MAERDPNHHNTGRAIALVGGGALLVWLLLRGKGWGLGGGEGKGGNGSDAPGTSAIAEAPAERRDPCQVFVGARQIELDGAPADLPTVVAHCRAGGQAHVRTTGGASVQAVEDVIGALQAAGVTVTVATRLGGSAGRKP